MDDGPYWVILLMYGSHDVRHTGFHRLTVVNGTPGFWGVTRWVKPMLWHMAHIKSKIGQVSERHNPSSISSHGMV